MSAMNYRWHDRAALRDWLGKLAAEAGLLREKLGEPLPLVVFGDAETDAWVRANEAHAYPNPLPEGARAERYDVKVTDDRGERYRLRVRPEDVKHGAIRVAILYEEEGLVTVRLPGATPGQSAAVFTRRALASDAPGEALMEALASGTAKSGEPEG